MGQEPEKAKKQKKPRREDKRKKRQIRLGIEILAEKKDGMTLKRFEKKLRKRSPSHSDLADLIDAVGGLNGPHSISADAICVLDQVHP